VTCPLQLWLKYSNVGFDVQINSIIDSAAAPTDSLVDVVSANGWSVDEGACFLLPESMRAEYSALKVCTHISFARKY
jgi:hypothetical protein